MFLDNRSIPRDTCEMIFADRDINYMIMIDDHDMPVRVRNESFSIGEMLDRVETRYGKILYKLVPVGVLGSAQTDLDLFVHTGSASVKIPSSGRSVNFVALRTKVRSSKSKRRLFLPPKLICARAKRLWG